MFRKNSFNLFISLSIQAADLPIAALGDFEALHSQPITKCEKALYLI